jgi:phosphoribosylformylglycinamidine cyclo-ligase
LQSNGNVADEEMYRVFNCGIGMIIIVPADKADAISATLSEQGETVYQLGEILERQEGQAQTEVV